MQYSKLSFNERRSLPNVGPTIPLILTVILSNPFSLGSIIDGLTFALNFQ